MTSLVQASLAALDAVETGDLDALGDALEVRELALRRGELPTQEVLNAGERAHKLLHDLVVRLQCEKIQLQRLESFTKAPPRTGLVDLLG